MDAHLRITIEARFICLEYKYDEATISRIKEWFETYKDWDLREMREKDYEPTADEVRKMEHGALNEAIEFVTS